MNIQGRVRRSNLSPRKVSFSLPQNSLAFPSGLELLQFSRDMSLRQAHIFQLRTEKGTSCPNTNHQTQPRNRDDELRKRKPNSALERLNTVIDQPLRTDELSVGHNKQSRQ